MSTQVDVVDVAREAYRLGYRRGVSDHASGTVKVTRTQQGYVIDRTEEADNVSKNAAAERQQRD